MSKKERFHFDDEEKIIEEPINEQPNDQTTEEVEDVQVVPEIEEVEYQGVPEAVEYQEEQEEEVMPKKRKFKYKFRVWHVFLLLFLAACLAFGAYIYFGSRNDGPVYGDRCISAVTLSTDAIQDVIDSYEDHEEIESLSIEAECLIIKISITFIAETSQSDGCALAEDVLKDLDIALGYGEYEGSEYSSALNMMDGENQYDIEFILQSEDSEAYPIFGTKHATVDEVSYTTASPVNQSTTDKILEQYETEEETEEE